MDQLLRKGCQISHAWFSAADLRNDQLYLTFSQLPHSRQLTTFLYSDALWLRTKGKGTSATKK